MRCQSCQVKSTGDGHTLNAVGNSAALGIGWNLYEDNGFLIDPCPFGPVMVMFGVVIDSGIVAEFAQSQYGIRKIFAASLYCWERFGGYSFAIWIAFCWRICS